MKKKEKRNVEDKGIEWFKAIILCYFLVNPAPAACPADVTDSCSRCVICRFPAKNTEATLYINAKSELI
jgi:hypothetical protein